MNTHADKSQNKKSQNVADNLFRRQDSDVAGVGSVESPAQIIEQVPSETVDNSPQVRQFRAYQRMANSSPRVKELGTYQAMANTASRIESKLNAPSAHVSEPEGGFRSRIPPGVIQAKFSRGAKPSAGGEAVIQKQIIAEGVEVLPDEILGTVVKETQGQVHLWLGGGEFKLTAKKAAEFLAAKNFPGQVSALLENYDKENRTFDNMRHLESQVIQDSKLIYLGLETIAGIDYHGGQFSTSDKSGGNRELRIYRTTTRSDWNNYLISKDIGGLLHGHGGGLGQALDYFYKSKNGEKNGPLYDNVIFEIKFTKKASAAIDYDDLAAGGEGGGPRGGKLTGKKEQNDILGESKVFSVNLSASKELILSMDPKIRRVDEMKGEDTQYSKRLLELALKKKEYPPNLTDEERLELDSLKDVK